VRKPRRLSGEELLPYQWQMPSTKRLRPDGPSETATHPLSWLDLFGNNNPIEIEVGMGKGLFLLNSALARPNINFFGIELARKYQLYATTRFARRKLMNVKTVCADARWLLAQFVVPGSVVATHVYFPDPWWKARHKKRRVFTLDFAQNIGRALMTGGRLHIASDVEEYFGVMSETVRATRFFRELHSETTTVSLEEAGYQTNFERKARQKGTPIWRADYERVAGISIGDPDPSS
jgi:tRNA (guanine-N7-)-methyltransferase